MSSEVGVFPLEWEGGPSVGGRAVLIQICRERFRILVVKAAKDFRPSQ